MAFDSLGIIVGDATVRLHGFEADFGEPAGAEALVFFDPPGMAHVHAYRREIADGALTCSLGGRAAAVTMDLGFAMRIVAEGLRAGLKPEAADIEALRAALAEAEGQGR
ncbi:hypothetical protein [Amaricoccus sp.]|uniref:hypothetical protein n=1 Tax=Amaricoccus sp. TaxID=1872485 RepID=UPI001B53D653|nr:hypothetical protein [Amaricoccus sp.]MBP7242345.1 hypothetical protein [Amaricoccus sp.]